MTTYEQRKQLVETEHAYLPNGLRCKFAGYSQPFCSVHSSQPGSYECTWETVLEVVKRPDRRFTLTELIRGNSPWGGLPVKAEDFQSADDYEIFLRAKR